MKSEIKVSTKKNLAIAIGLAGVLSMVLSLFITLQDAKNKLDNVCDSTTESFTSIMDSYRHSFTLFEVLLQKEIGIASGVNEIEAYLKQEDAHLLALEGEDYDGVYMYYQGEYLYSWDTPRSVYEESGYEVTERPWYIGAIEADGEIFFSVPYRSFANEYMLATISRLQPDGETVIAYDIKLGAIQNFVEHMYQYEGALTMLCDREGNIIGTTEALYAGGNYLLSQEEWTQRVEDAHVELEEADEGEQEKAQKKVESEEALQSFCRTNKEYLIRISNEPEILHLSLKNRMAGYAYDNGRHLCLVLIPFSQMLPTAVFVWISLFFVFTILIFLIENLLVRAHASVMLEAKNLQLAEAVVRADAANVAKGQFLAQMSHEIRTPMNAIIGLTGIAKTEVNSPGKITDYLNKIEGASKLLLGIINDVLDMSAIEGGKLKIDRAEFNFSNMLTNITTVFYEQAKMKGIEFEVRMNGVTEENMIGDELRVNQVLMNLLSNAVKFTPAGGRVELMVLQASCSLGKVQLRFQVSDTGCGMSEEMLGRLFQPFEQESASTARKHGGSGLGLSIAKKLVEMMGGSIQVESTQGKGSVFTVDIPFEIPENQQTMETIGFSDIRALVVDDDKDSCEYSGILLERLGVRYEYVTDGKTALKKLKEAAENQDPFTLCLIDWKMPEMNGSELACAIRSTFGENAVIIIVSAYDLNEIENSGNVEGSNYFISKPLFQSSLFNALMKISGGNYKKVEVHKEKEVFDFSGKRVLVAEDVILNMEVAVQLLGAVGIEVTCAEDGKQAVELFEKSEPGYYDCILMDINMPVMDGYEAAKIIRQYAREDARTIPVYAMTANAFAEDVTAALNAGMNGHIAKPIDVDSLYKTLETAFHLNQNGN